VGVIALGVAGVRRAVDLAIFQLGLTSEGSEDLSFKIGFFCQLGIA